MARNGRLRLARAALLSFILWLLAPGAWAQVSDAQAQAKIAPDLLAAVSGTSAPLVPWLKAINGQPMVKVLVASNSGDASLADLRSFVLSLGGSVFYNYASFRMVAVMVPASSVMDLARRPDVVSLSPNRAVVRASSTLQLTTGAANAGASNGSLLDGSGVGIAIVDSGIGYSHQNVSTTTLFNLKGPTRVRQALDWVKIGHDVGGADWVSGTDLSSAISDVLDGTAFTSILQASQLPRATRADPYGHGTHVASVAAGGGSYQFPDTSGVAPKAALYDVRVLDERGAGNVADVVAGIDWVIQHASSLHIRVMNLSLAAGSTESFLTD
ncbi:MAG TPA: S8 family serine peptidase, partial [Usitatibacter sp.]|nr:S8 family serine peptidase [Usitatibacter sp.]